MIFEINRQTPYSFRVSARKSDLTRLRRLIIWNSLLPVYLYFLRNMEVMKMRTIKGYPNGAGYMGWVDEYGDYMQFSTESDYIEYLEEMEVRNEN